MVGECDQEVGGAYSAGLKYREIQQILSQNEFKRSLGPVYQSSLGLAMAAGKEYSEWFMSSQVPIQHVKAIHRKEF